jgi:hypothetical protein
LEGSVFFGGLLVLFDRGQEGFVVGSEVSVTGEGDEHLGLPVLASDGVLDLDGLGLDLGEGGVLVPI